MPTPKGRAGYVALAGKPNVGKSTLLNAFLGQKIAAVTFRPQTTRKQQMGILTREESQAVFIDTPGIHRPHHKLGEQMNASPELLYKSRNQVVAKSFYRHLKSEGFTHQQIIELSTTLLDLVTEDMTEAPVAEAR